MTHADGVDGTLTKSNSKNVKETKGPIEYDGTLIYIDSSFVLIFLFPDPDVFEDVFIQSRSVKLYCNQIVKVARDLSGAKKVNIWSFKAILLSSFINFKII